MTSSVYTISPPSRILICISTRISSQNNTKYLFQKRSSQEWAVHTQGLTHDTLVGQLRLVGSLKLQISFAKEPYKRDDTLQRRRMILRSLLIIATPYKAAKTQSMPYLYRSFSAKETCDQWLFCEKTPATEGILWVFATLQHNTNYRAALHKMTYKNRHPLGLQQNTSVYLQVLATKTKTYSAFQRICVCLYECIYTCIQHTWEHSYMQVCIYVYMKTKTYDAYQRICVCLYKCIYVYIQHTLTQSSICVYVHIWKRKFTMRLSISAYVHTCKCIYIYIANTLEQSNLNVCIYMYVYVYV